MLGCVVLLLRVFPALLQMNKGVSEDMQGILRMGRRLETLHASFTDKATYQACLMLSWVPGAAFAAVHTCMQGLELF